MAEETRTIANPSPGAKVESFGAIVIMGVSGCGKSTIGRMLAKELSCPFIEGDELHDAASIAKMRTGEALSDSDRWPWLDRVANALRLALTDSGTAVAACSALKVSYRDRLRHALPSPTNFVLLDASRTELLVRLQKRADHFMPPNLLDSQLETLERPTESEDALILSATASPSDSSQSIRIWLARAGDRQNNASAR